MPENIREPIGEGRYYPDNKKELASIVGMDYSFFLRSVYLRKEFAKGIRKKGKTNKKAKRSIKGILSPHGAYNDGIWRPTGCGLVYPIAFDQLRVDGRPATYIILGPIHDEKQVFEGGVYTSQTFRTLLGDVPVDTNLLGRISDLLGESLIDGTEMHSQEHSIENQLPWLQMIHNEGSIPYSRKPWFRDCYDDPISIVPIGISTYAKDYDVLKNIGMKVGELCKDEDVVIVGTSDFTHCAHFSDRSFGLPKNWEEGQDMIEYAGRQDDKALDRIKDYDASGLVEIVKKENITMCGHQVVYVMLEALKKMGANWVGNEMTFVDCTSRNPYAGMNIGVGGGSPKYASATGFATLTFK